jgi:hypothetical protein
LVCVDVNARPADLLTQGPGVSDPGSHTLDDQIALELGHRSKDTEQQLARRRRGIHALGEADKVDVEGIKLFQTV